MRRVLILASVASMIDQFNMPFIDLLQKMGYGVDVACNFIEGSTCSNEKIKTLQEKLDSINVNWYQIDFSRNIGNIAQNVKAYNQVKKILLENDYCFLHCHSPIGGVVGRLAGYKTKTNVIYTAHGFHFYKGSSIMSWLVFYPIEKYLSKYTDVLITINTEDYVCAKNKMDAKEIYYVPGVGVDLEKFCTHGTDVKAKRYELQIPEDKIWILNVGELIPRKNQAVLLEVVSKFENVYLTIAGIGPLYEKLSTLIYEQDLQDRVKLIGFRTDISELCEACDVFAFPSFQEGLSVALMEAMACGKPIICSDIRGNVDLIDSNGGELFDPHSYDELQRALSRVLNRDLNNLGKYNSRKIKEFDLETVLYDMRLIYEKFR